MAGDAWLIIMDAYWHDWHTPFTIRQSAESEGSSVKLDKEGLIVHHTHPNSVDIQISS